MTDVIAESVHAVDNEYSWLGLLIRKGLDPGHRISSLLLQLKYN